MTTHNGFFAVGQDTFVAACDLGINPACALLVMACGTGKDNSTTKWSAEAVSNHVGVRWGTAKDAIGALCGAGLVTKGGKPTRPSYKLQKEGALIWLPRTLIEGAAGETSPVDRMRQTQDPMALRLLIELYLSQNLREDGGISTKTTYRAYERRRAGEYASYVVWDFTGGLQTVVWTDAAIPHKREARTQEEVKNRGADFFRRFGTLASLGLVEWVPYLYDGPKGEPMYPMAWDGLEIEKELYEAATGAAERMLQGYATDIEGLAVPVPKHIAEATLIGVARLKYRPHTALTSAWWAEHQSNCREAIEEYAALAAPKVVPIRPAVQRSGTDNEPF